MAGFLSAAGTSVSSPKVVEVESSEVDRSTVYSGLNIQERLTRIRLLN
jgi:hypothetical protein